MYRGTTPTITINCDIDVSEFVTMWVTFRTQKLATYAPPKQVEVTKRLGDEGVDATDKVVTVSLTQADTLLLGSLSPDEDQQVEVQIRGRTEDGRAFASNIMTAPLSRIPGGAALTPESDKIYVILSEGEYQNKTYRWSGTTYAVIGNDIAIGETASTAYRGDRGKTAYDHSQSAHAPADAEKNVQSDWNETDGNSDAFIKNKPAIPKAVTKTVQTLSDAASKSFTVTGYILSVILIDSATKEQVIGDVSFENATASANGKVTVTLAAAPSNPILVIITSIAL